MRPKVKFILLLSLITLGFLVSECSKSKDTFTVTNHSYVVQLYNSATLGNYLTDKSGNALYFYSNDTAVSNTCAGGCAANWQVFYVPGLTQAKLQGGFVGDFDSISTTSGMQLTYKGQPLYYYAPGGTREAPGLTSGDGVGGVWYVARPDYTIMFAHAQLVGANGKSYVVSPDNVYTEGTGKTNYFTDMAGRTLYAFAQDTARMNNFTLADFSNNSTWPIFEVSQVVLPSILNKSDFTFIHVAGHTQMTYRGRPLYYYGADVDAVTGKFRGNTKGVSVGATIGTWFVLFKDIPWAPLTLTPGGYDGN